MSQIQDPSNPQPKPVQNSSPYIHDEVAVDLLTRKMHGIVKYKVGLQAENSRNALLDAYEELLDQAVYIKQELLERQKLAEMLDKLLNKFALGDKVYGVRERATFDSKYKGESWEHPRVVEFSEMVTYFENLRKRIVIGFNPDSTSDGSGGHSSGV